MNDRPNVYGQPGHPLRRAKQIAVSMFYSTMGYEVKPVQYVVLRILQDHAGIDQGDKWKRANP
ncbi:MAG: hypothetical protein HRJ53_13660 [Acidobacteria bacterium Pan2503]|uniref:Uncharacterized protein n=1 Tax=Candidatus Acidiferrum panamense TaxID=2741543 RepID=A0A7V8SX92_9BACT|nr:hypothetical protein [Candidatus Acidoferrum panamensis]